EVGAVALLVGPVDDAVAAEGRADATRRVVGAVGTAGEGSAQEADVDARLAAEVRSVADLTGLVDDAVAAARRLRATGRVEGARRAAGEGAGTEAQALAALSAEGGAVARLAGKVDDAVAAARRAGAAGGVERARRGARHDTRSEAEAAAGGPAHVGAVARFGRRVGRSVAAERHVRQRGQRLEDEPGHEGVALPASVRELLPFEEAADRRDLGAQRRQAGQGQAGRRGVDQLGRPARTKAAARVALALEESGAGVHLRVDEEARPVGGEAHQRV